MLGRGGGYGGLGGMRKEFCLCHECSYCCFKVCMIDEPSIVKHFC